MEDKRIKEGFESITPSSEQKARMLRNILAREATKEKGFTPAKVVMPEEITWDNNNKIVEINSYKNKWVRNLGMVAACFVMVIIGTTVVPISQVTPLNSPMAPAVDAPMSSPFVDGILPTDSPLSQDEEMAQPVIAQHMNYNGYQYDFIETPNMEEMRQSHLKNKLGTLKDVQNQGGIDEDFSQGLIDDSVIWEISKYDPYFRLLVERDGHYYLFQNVGKIDDTPLSLEEYFEVAQLAQIIRGVEVRNGLNGEVLHVVDKSEELEVINMIQESQFIDKATLEDAQIIDENRDDNITVELKLEDNTSLQVCITPENKMMSMGVNYFQISDDLQKYLKNIPE